MEYGPLLKQYLLEEGASEIGFSNLEAVTEGTPVKEEKGAQGLAFGVSVVVRLSDAVVEGIQQGPTYAYFHHYRTVNAHIDALLLKAGIWIQKRGFRYFPIAASQSVGGYFGMFPHKTAARLAGLGRIGKSGLFVSDRFGARVRLGTLLTDMPLPTAEHLSEKSCGDCRLCVKRCPAMALDGRSYEEIGEAVIDRQACSKHMKAAYSHVGRGAVCGICMSCCKG